MDLHLTGKTALITGSTKGIGKSIATIMAQAGANVIINGRGQNVVDEVVNEMHEKYPNIQVTGAAYVASPIPGAFSGEALKMDGGMVPTIF